MNLDHIAAPLRQFAVATSSLTLDPANVRKHSDRNIADIAESLRAFGQQSPIVVDSAGVVRKGNGTLTAARRLGWSMVAAITTGLSGAQLDAYGIADNRTGETSEWDQQALADLLAAIDAAEVDTRATGFHDEEIAALVKALEPAPEIKEDEAPAPPAEPITKPGDLWIMGGHRLLCGDSTKAEDVARLMAGDRADLCFTSPPYDKQRDYTAEGKEHCADWFGLMKGVFGNLPMAPAGQVLVNLGLIHREGEWIPYWDLWIEWMRGQGWRRFGWYVWDQGSGLPGDWNGRLAPSHEFVFHFNREAVKPAKWIETQQASRDRGQSDRVRHAKGERVPAMRGKDGTVKEISSPETRGQAAKIPDSVIRRNRHAHNQFDENDVHPAPFSVAFAAFGLQTWEGLVYEPFSGGGTTIIAAEQLSRRAFAIEIAPAYVDVACERFFKLTGVMPTKEDGTKWR